MLAAAFSFSCLGKQGLKAFIPYEWVRERKKSALVSSSAFMSGYLGLHNEQWTPRHVVILAALFLPPCLCAILEKLSGMQLMKDQGLGVHVFLVYRASDGGKSTDKWVSHAPHSWHLMVMLVGAVMALVEKEWYLTAWSGPVGRRILCVTRDKLIVILWVCTVWEM